MVNPKLSLSWSEFCVCVCGEGGAGEKQSVHPYLGGKGLGHCSRLKPSYEFHFEGLSNFSSSTKRLVQIQDFNLRIYKWNTSLIWIIWYMFPIQYEELRINNLTLLRVVTMPYACWFLWWEDYIKDFNWHLHFQFGVALCRVVLREVYFKGHWRLQSWTLVWASN